MVELNFDILGESLTYQLVRPLKPKNSAPKVLLDEDDNLLKDTKWDKKGYFIAPSLKMRPLKQLREGASEILKGCMKSAGLNVGKSFSLEKYHEWVDDDELHSKVISQLGNWLPISFFPIRPQLIYQRVSNLLDLEVGGSKHIAEGFGIRVVRPFSRDHNPPHRDVWINRLRNAINLYLPLAGSNCHSSLPLVPESHRWNESEILRTQKGAKLEKFSYTVPTVISAKKKLKFIRPDPSLNEMLVFSPYLIHGGAMNLNEGMTRVSLEMRLWRA